MTADRRAALVEKANSAYFRVGIPDTPNARMAAAFDLIRAEVLEEAAKICDRVSTDMLTKVGREHEPFMRATAEDCAAAIRALKGGT